MDAVQEKLPDGVQLEEIQFHTIKDTYRIDAGTFRFLGEKLDYEAAIPTSNGTVVNVERHWESNLKGDFHGKIEVPEDVKSQAEEE
jgi:hypothetical protein